MSDSWMKALRDYGGEYGAATGRPRRVGPFDAVASRYGLKCQKADKIALTKLDVLSAFSEIPIIIGYHKNGTITKNFDQLDNIHDNHTVIEYLPGWTEDISACESWEQLPDNAKAYVAYLEKQLDHEIQFVSVGAKREQYIVKGEWVLDI